MKPSQGSILTAAVIAAVFLWVRSATARAIDATTGLPEVDMGDLDTSEISVMNAPQVSNISTGTADQMLDAFLYMIRSCEHLDSMVATEKDYTEFYGGTQFSNLSDHPVLTGELKGVPLPYEMCVAAGFASGNCVSTAAGAYQITVPTWKEFSGRYPNTRYSNDPLPDFGKDSQDTAAIRILDFIGATPLIQSGNITQAIALASARWASLPGSKNQQNPKPVDFALAKFNEGMA